jgi:hypothetical protein
LKYEVKFVNKLLFVQIKGQSESTLFISLGNIVTYREIFFFDKRFVYFVMTNSPCGADRRALNRA